MSRAVHYIAALAGSGLFVVIVLALARRGWLSMRYTVGWLVVAICVFVAGVGAGLASPSPTHSIPNPSMSSSPEGSSPSC